MYTQKQAFTLVEILVVLALFASISLLGVQSFMSLRDARTLEKDVSNVLALLSRARTQTVNSRYNTFYSVYATSTFVALIEGDTYISDTDSNEVYTLSQAVSLSDIALAGGGNTIVFNRLTGGTDTFGTLTFSFITSSASTTTAIRINGTGTAEHNE